MKIYIRNTSKIYAGASSKPEGASNSLKFYHYDDREFSVGDVITGNFYPTQFDVIKAEYSKVCPEIDDITKVLYMYDAPVDESFEVYKFGYVVSPDCCLRRFSDYSYVMCCLHINDIVSKHSAWGEKTLSNVISEYSTLMANAYIGNHNAMKSLKDSYSVDISNEIEYISNNGTIVSVIQNPDK